jgi:hypothetical protein
MAHDRLKTSAARQIGGFSEVLTAIVFSATAVEGFLNELVERLENTPPKTLQEPLIALRVTLGLAERSRASTELKLQLAVVALARKVLDTRQGPFQEFGQLLALRNAIVHYRPAKVGLREEHSGDGESEIAYDRQNLLRTLESKKLLPRREPALVLGFLTLIGTRAVARWAINTGCAIVNGLMDLMPDERFARPEDRSWFREIPAEPGHFDDVWVPTARRMQELRRREESAGNHGDEDKLEPEDDSQG